MAKAIGVYVMIRQDNCGIFVRRSPGQIVAHDFMILFLLTLFLTIQGATRPYRHSALWPQTQKLTWHSVIRDAICDTGMIPVSLFIAIFTLPYLDMYLYQFLCISVNFYLFNTFLQLSQGFRAFRFATFLALGLQRRVSVAGQSSLKCRLAQLVS